MAWDFGAQINALTGFDANLDSASEEGEDYTTLSVRWLSDAAKEVINLLPLQMLQRCAKEGTAFAPTTGEVHEEKVISVIRAKTTDFNIGEVYDCREIPYTLSHKAADEDSLEYAVETDPVFYYEPQTDTNAVKIKVLPASSSSLAKAYSVDYPTVDHSHSAIDNFPDEAEHLVVLRAAITAVEYKLNFEEDAELYIPILSTLKSQYQEAVMGLKTGNIGPQQQKAG